jgi:flagellin-like hook-associated protein FlgL
MTRISTNLTRTTSMQVSDQLLSALRKTQRDMAKAEQAIATGREVTKPSDAPDKIAAILLLQTRLEARGQEEKNVEHGAGVLDNVDSALADVGEILLEAKAIASSQIGVGSDATTRANQAIVIDAHIASLIDIANRQHQDLSLFGGGSSLGRDAQVFQSFLGGVRYVGASTNIQGDFGLGSPLDFNSNGAEAFGALSTRVVSQADLDPQLTAATPLKDLTGVLEEGIRKGSLVVTVDGTRVVVDLNSADTAGDVVTRINSAIAGIDAAAGALALGGDGFDLTAAAGHTIAIADSGNGRVAADLGIVASASGGTVAGADVNVKLSERTTLASLGKTIDFASGLLITNGSSSKVADFSAAVTVQDMMNIVADLRIGVRLTLNENGSAMNLVSEVSGIELSIGENGGTTAQDLGLRSFAPETSLADLRFGLGIEPVAGQDEFAIQLHNGTTFSVDLDSAHTIGDVLAAISAAASAAGLTVGNPGDAGTDFNLGLAATGNGFRFEDGTAGGGDFRVTQLGTSLVATQLGIYTNAGAGGVIAGGDVAKVKTDSVFTHLIALRDALRRNDSSGITLAGEGLERSIDQVTQARADVGVKARRLEQQQERLQEMQIAEKSTLSTLQDADLAEVITRLTQLQQQLKASLQSGLTNMQLTLLDFLR